MNERAEAKLLIKHYRQVSLLLYELSETHEGGGSGYKAASNKTAKAAFGGLKRFAVKLGIKDKLKNNKLYKNLHKKGIMDMLNK